VPAVGRKRKLARNPKVRLEDDEMLNRPRWRAGSAFRINLSALEFPFEIEKLAGALDLYDPGLAGLRVTNGPTQLLDAMNRHPVQ